MTDVFVSGANVSFPFEPYPCQITYMEKVLACLKDGINGVLESPTGTGKTLCLLCSSLAWLTNKKAQIKGQMYKIGRMNETDGFDIKDINTNDFKDKLSNDLINAAGAWAGEMSIPKIIFASRTHSQLSQAVQELKNTAYRNMKVCVIGSREQLCIHPQVMKEENNTTKVHLCRAKVQARTCNFYNNVEAQKPNFASQGVMDIEDIVKFGEKNKCCPYYAAREMKNEADVIFMPYNYLLDPKTRKAHNVELQGNVIIFDEAHNLEKICEESSSFELSSSDLASAIRDLSDLSDKIAEFARLEEQGGAETSESDAAITQDFTLKELLEIKAILHNLEEDLDKVEVPEKNDAGVTKPGHFIFEMLTNVGVTFETKNHLIDLCDKITQHLSNEGTRLGNKGSGISKFSDILKIVFSREPLQSVNLLDHQKVVSKHYRVHIRASEKRGNKRSTGWDSASSVGSKAGRSLNYWCFSPGHAMQELMAHGVRCVVLTSGTLAPLHSFTAEMGIDFPIQLENPHVIDKHQVWIGTIGKGPDSVVLNSSYEHRFREDYQKSLGNAVVNFARVTPMGLLLFFPSYPVMNKCLETWQKENIWSRIEQYKPVYVEPRNKHEFLTAMENFYERIRDPAHNGAVFAAVCRGKVSEGLDFADNNGRAVVITGLPFPPRMDPRVVLKMQFLDDDRRQGGKGLSGQEWYRQQATRAVNQAVGRVIRHKEDFGAIVLCDNRFESGASRNQLPVWIRPSVKVYDKFGLALKDLMIFFKTAEKTLPVPRTGGSKSRGAVGPSTDPSVHYQPSVSRLRAPADLPRSCDVEQHVPSLAAPATATDALWKRRLRVDYEGGSGAAGSTKPTNLFDAIEQSEDRFDYEYKPSPAARAKVDSSHNIFKRKIVIKKPGTCSSVTETTAKRESVKSADAYVTEVRNRFCTDICNGPKIKQVLSMESYKAFSGALRKYRTTADYTEMISVVADLFTDDPNKYPLLRKFYRFVRPQHKLQFDTMCINITGQGCGFKPTDAVSKKRPASETATSDPGLKRQKSSTLDTKTSTLDTKSTTKCDTVSGVSEAKLHLNQGATHLASSAAAEMPKTEDRSKENVDAHSATDSSSQDSQGTGGGEHREGGFILTDNSPGPTMSGPEPNQNLRRERYLCWGPRALSGYRCSLCQLEAIVPLRAQCNHIACAECWKEKIRGDKTCPACGRRVKRKQLTQLIFPTGKDFKK